jgi:hypothetical protein
MSIEGSVSSCAKRLQGSRSCNARTRFGIARRKVFCCRQTGASLSGHRARQRRGLRSNANAIVGNKESITRSEIPPVFAISALRGYGVVGSDGKLGTAAFPFRVTHVLTDNGSCLAPAYPSSDASDERHGRALQWPDRKRSREGHAVGLRGGAILRRTRQAGRPADATQHRRRGSSPLCGVVGYMVRAIDVGLERQGRHPGDHR